ncbi:MAG: hypothetical protein M3P50_05415, partial [Actinomycetota bacterium]|nr:hypothetical protein [Actinomycetota bacterium]
ALLGARAWRSEAARFARLSGSSVAAPDAAGWVTDFLNAAYFQRPAELRELDDLRLAFAIVTTRWHRKGNGRLRAHDVVAFHRAFGRDRFLETVRARRGTLDRAQLLAGADRLHGPWFSEGYADAARRGWGIVFETPQERRAFDPRVRLGKRCLGELTPATAPAAERTWHTYQPVDVPDARAALAALTAVEHWPDYATEIGRFTATRAGDLDGQTFEIEVAAGTEAGAPVYTRGYVTATRLLTDEADPDGLGAYADALNDGLARFGDGEPPAVPDGATPVAALELTTHEGHFMGRGSNRILLYEERGQAKLRAAGTWDPMPRHLQQAYELAGRRAQAAFWGDVPDPRRSMLHQIALACR